MAKLTVTEKHRSNVRRARQMADNLARTITSEKERLGRKVSDVRLDQEIRQLGELAALLQEAEAEMPEPSAPPAPEPEPVVEPKEPPADAAPEPPADEAPRGAMKGAGKGAHK